MADLAWSRSTPTSLWSYFTTLPFTSTVCTSPRPAWNTTWPYGCSTGKLTGELSFLISTRSAFLPASTLPTTESRPSAFAPPRVA